MHWFKKGNFWKNSLSPFRCHWGQEVVEANFWISSSFYKFSFRIFAVLGFKAVWPEFKCQSWKFLNRLYCLHILIKTTHQLWCRSKSIWFRREKIRPNKGRARTPRQWGRPTCRWWCTPKATTPGPRDWSRGRFRGNTWLSRGCSSRFPWRKRNRKSTFVCKKEIRIKSVGIRKKEKLNFTFHFPLGAVL